MKNKKPQEPTKPVSPEEKPEDILTPDKILTPEELKIWQAANTPNPELDTQIATILQTTEPLSTTTPKETQEQLATVQGNLTHIISDPKIDSKLREQILRDYKLTTDILQSKVETILQSKIETKPEQIATLVDTELSKFLQQTNEDLLRATQEKFGSAKTRNQFYAALDANNQIHRQGDLAAVIAAQQELRSAFEDFLVAHNATNNTTEQQTLTEQLTYNIERITGPNNFLTSVENLFDEPLTQAVIENKIRHIKASKLSIFNKKNLPYRFQKVLDGKTHILCDRKISGQERCPGDSNTDFQKWLYIKCVECGNENDFCEDCFLHHEQARECYQCCRKFTLNDLEKATMYDNS